MTRPGAGNGPGEGRSGPPADLPAGAEDAWERIRRLHGEAARPRSGGRHAAPEGPRPEAGAGLAPYPPAAEPRYRRRRAVGEAEHQPPAGAAPVITAGHDAGEGWTGAGPGAVPRRVNGHPVGRHHAAGPADAEPPPRPGELRPADGPPAMLPAANGWHPAGSPLDPPGRWNGMGPGSLVLPAGANGRSGTAEPESWHPAAEPATDRPYEPPWLGNGWPPAAEPATEYSGGHASELDDRPSTAEPAADRPDELEDRRRAAEPAADRRYEPSRLERRTTGGPDGPAPIGTVQRPPVPGRDAESTQLLHRYVPAREVLDREDRDPPPRPAPARRRHPPRAVVRRRRARRRLLEWPVLIVVALVSAYLIRAFVLQTFYIPSGSMHETLVEGDRVLVNKVSYHLHEVDRGDVVVFRRPPDFPVEDEDLIKRVVALPGETVEARGRQVYVDGRPLSEPYVQQGCSGTQDFAPVSVPAGSLWVMGDNRCNSSDSRVFGPVSEDLLVGRAFVLAWPVGRLAWL